MLTPPGTATLRVVLVGQGQPLGAGMEVVAETIPMPTPVQEPNWLMSSWLVQLGGVVEQFCVHETLLLPTTVVRVAVGVGVLGGGPGVGVLVGVKVGPPPEQEMNCQVTVIRPSLM